MGNRLRWAGTLVLAVAACGGGAKTTPTAQAPVRAAVARATSDEVPLSVELSGTVEAERVASVSSRVMATVTAVAVKVGDRVTAGQLLVEIDPQTAKGQEAQARGALAQAQAALALGERNYGRFQALAKKGAASELELDLARMQFDQAKGAVEQAQGAVEAASSVARESRVTAPFAGTVTAKWVEAGDLAAPGRPLVSVESALGRRLVVGVPETVMASSALAVGSNVAFRLDAAPGLGEMSGPVVEVGPTADGGSHSFRVKIAVSAPDIPAGAAGRAWVTTGRRTVISVPATGVLAQGGLHMVVVRDANGLARSRAVTVGGALPGDRVEVLSGISNGDEVLVGLAVPPADGAPVEEVRP
jgi:RND family efflux transporter MFP subunit